jgi:lipoprotein NlpI
VCFNLFSLSDIGPALLSYLSVRSWCLAWRRAGLGLVGAVSMSISMSPALAQVVAPAPASPVETPLQEISVAASAFVRGAPLPAWADLLPLPPESTARRALTVRMEDTHLRLGVTPVQLVNTARQANDPGALGQLGQVSIFFTPAYQRLLLHKVMILRGTGFIDHTASVQVRFLQREAQLEQGIYSGVITATMLLPDVRVGDTLLLQYSIEGANPIFGNRYANVLPWEQAAPAQVRRITIIHSDSRPLRWRWMGGVTPSPAGLETPTESRTADGMRRLRFEQRDVAAIEVEPMLPRGFAPMHWLQFSEFQDWADVSRWADALFASDAPLPEEMTPVMQRLLSLPTRAEQASAALQWVQSEIRYYSVSLGESSHRPHAPAEVLRNRYGDCKDKSFLLMRMLQSLGMQARPVLASLSAPQRPGRMLPSPLAFDHVVVQLRLDGRDHYLDPTRLGQRSPLDRIGQGLEEASVLVVDGREVDALSIVRSSNRRELFGSELTEKFRVTGFSEDAELETTQQWNGLEAEQLRLTVARFDAARLQRAAIAGIDRRYPGITLVGTPEVSDAIDQNRITVRSRYKIPKLVSEQNGNWAMRFLPANLQGALMVPPSPTRTQPLALPSFPRRITYSAEVQWPDSVSGVNDPFTQRIANPQFTAEVTRSFRGSVSRTSLQFEALASEVPAKDVPKLMEDVQQLNRMVVGAMGVAKTQIKDGGFLGLGKKTLQDTLQARALSVVDRTGKAIADSALAGDDLAEALCIRAEALLELGRVPEGVLDAQAAVKAAPALARAWQCRGNLDWANSDFTQASADFGKALTLGQNPYDAYLRRGQARFYEGRLEQAAEDFAKAVADRAQPGDKPYAMLWQAWTLQRLQRPLPGDLTARAVKDSSASWPLPALAMFTGQATPEQVLQSIATRQGDDRELALAEAWFYIGQYQLNRADPAKAREAFEKARAKGISIYIEHAAAGFELQRLAGKP